MRFQELLPFRHTVTIRLLVLAALADLFLNRIFISLASFRLLNTVISALVFLMGVLFIFLTAYSYITEERGDKNLFSAGISLCIMLASGFMLSFFRTGVLAVLAGTLFTVSYGAAVVAMIIAAVARAEHELDRGSFVMLGMAVVAPALAALFALMHPSDGILASGIRYLSNLAGWCYIAVAVWFGRQVVNDIREHGINTAALALAVLLIAVMTASAILSHYAASVVETAAVILGMRVLLPVPVLGSVIVAVFLMVFYTLFDVRSANETIRLRFAFALLMIAGVALEPMQARFCSVAACALLLKN
ncbi:MAG: hypothetical protein HZC28_09610 [Spirochaetes bacterium]|nr:hypothetical protein [Spirochaetota bacterium]